MNERIIEKALERFIFGEIRIQNESAGLLFIGYIEDFIVSQKNKVDIQLKWLAKTLQSKQDIADGVMPGPFFLYAWEEQPNYPVSLSFDEIEQIMKGEGDTLIIEESEQDEIVTLHIPDDKNHQYLDINSVKNVGFVKNTLGLPAEEINQYPKSRQHSLAFTNTLHIITQCMDSLASFGNFEDADELGEVLFEFQRCIQQDTPMSDEILEEQLITLAIIKERFMSYDNFPYADELTLVIATLELLSVAKKPKDSDSETMRKILQSREISDN